MECACISDDVDEFSTLLSSSKPKARKEHWCCECRRTINKGERYLKETLIYDGDISTYKTCLDCISVRDHYVCDFVYGRVWELISENLDASISWKKIEKLTPSARNKLLEMIENQWEEEDDDGC